MSKKTKLYLITSLILLTLIVFAGCENPWMKKNAGHLVKDNKETKKDDVIEGIRISTSGDWARIISEMESSGTYTIILDSGFDITGNASTPTFGNLTGIDVTIIGNGNALTLSGTGNLLRLVEGQKVTIQDVILYGTSLSNPPLVAVVGGEFIMGGTSSIAGNYTTMDGGGVRVTANGTFIMNGGTISGNTAHYGGGVDVVVGTFFMNGGTISGNMAQNGGGVYVDIVGIFNKNGGSISGNTATVTGASLYVTNGGSTNVPGFTPGADWSTDNPLP